jgi:hypothetical protein
MFCCESQTPHETQQCRVFNLVFQLPLKSETLLENTNR